MHCPQCHQMVDGDLPFCTSCGALLGDSPEAENPPAVAPVSMQVQPKATLPAPAPPPAALRDEAPYVLPTVVKQSSSWVRYVVVLALVAAVIYAAVQVTFSRPVSSSESPASAVTTVETPRTAEPPAPQAQDPAPSTPPQNEQPAPAKEEPQVAETPEDTTKVGPSELNAAIEAEVKKDPILALAIVAEHIDFNQLCANPESSPIAYEAFMKLRVSELDLLRNTICARHGYIFSKREYREHFSRQPWYQGVTSDTAVVDASMGETAVQNTKWFLSYAKAIREQTASDVRLDSFRPSTTP